MLNLLHNQLNSLDVTVSNESELNNPTYLWVLTNLETKDKKYFIPYNATVPHAGRYDTFTFTTYPLSPEVLTGSTCNLHLAQGQYTYTIYDQVQPTNLNPLLSNNVVEVGMARMEQNEICFTTYVSENDDVEMILYDDPSQFFTYITDNDEVQAVVFYNPDINCFGLKWNEANVNWNNANFNWENSNPVVT
jgi:hypothetical protein